MMIAGEAERLRADTEEVFGEAFAPIEDLTVSECADKYRVLPPTSPAAGRHRTDNVPYIRAIQDALGDETKPEVVWAKASRVAGTTVGENYIQYRVLFRRGGILSVWPTEQKYLDWVSEKLDPMIDDCPELTAKFGRKSRRDEHGGGRREAGDSLHRKVFPGGWLQGITSKSISQLKSLGAECVIFEEPDEYVVTRQGDVIALGRVRAREHGDNRKIYINGSPTYAGASVVWNELEASTWNEYHVPCPHCGLLQVLKWREGDGDNIEAGGYYFVWEKDADGWPIPGTARYVCRECDKPIEERHKYPMLLAGEWIPRHPKRVGVPGRAEGFHISALYSPFLTWDEVAIAWTKAVRMPSEMRVFVNTVLGLPYHETDTKLDPHFLAARAGPYGEGVEVPHGVGILTCGVDVQGDRVEPFVWGWGWGAMGYPPCWYVPLEPLEGDPRQPAVWRRLAREVLQRGFRHASGATVRIQCMAVDAGYATEHVHRFCDTYQAAFAVVGRSGPGKHLLASPNEQRRKWRDKKRPSHVVGTDTAKNDLFGRFRVQDPTDAGYVHFPENLDPGFYEQLTAEHLVRKKRDGRHYRTWERADGRANEALDGWVYARAALRKLELEDPTLLASLAKRAAKLSAWKPPEERPPPKKRGPGRSGGRGRGWVNGWKDS